MSRYSCGSGVEAKEDEDVLFSWFEYPDRAARDAAIQKMMSDPRMEALGQDMPFDGKRMIMGGFDSILDDGEGRGGTYLDGFILPVRDAQKAEYQALAERMAKTFLDQGALRVVEAAADDVQHGKVTDFYRATKAEDGETVVFSFIEWPDKQARDDAWAKIMADESMKPEGDMPFSGQRMFWGGFDNIIDTANVREAAEA